MQRKANSCETESNVRGAAGSAGGAGRGGPLRAAHAGSGAGHICVNSARLGVFGRAGSGWPSGGNVCRTRRTNMASHRNGCAGAG